MRRFGSYLVRLGSFFQKETAEVLRQPRLIIYLIFGPFLIMLLFGLGYRSDQPPLRTMFVVKQESEMSRAIELTIRQDATYLSYAGQTNDIEAMKSALNRRTIDLGVVVPDNAYQTIKGNQQAVFEVFHNELDPMQSNYIVYLAQVYVDMLNRGVLSSFAQTGQSDASALNVQLTAAIDRVRGVRSALERGDVAAAKVEQQGLKRNISAVDLAVGASLQMLGGIGSTYGDPDAQTTEVIGLMDTVKTSPTGTEELQEGKSDYNREISDAAALEESLVKLQTSLQEFTAVSPSVLTRPFISKVTSITPLEMTPMGFFTPGVIVLLLQHVTITLAALSIVREKRSGTMELFRVSPISPGEVLIGKYLAYLLIGIVLAAALGLLLAFGLRAPMLGAWANAGATVVLLILASLGIGFTISLVSNTESQAVQLSMLMLLFSVFFSGFFLDLRFLVGPVKFISWIIPATYGTMLLQNIMLRGFGLVLAWVVNLSTIALVMFLISWLLMRKKMAQE